MPDAFNPTHAKQQAWALGETKLTYIEILQQFIKSRIAFIHSLNNMDDPLRAKIEYISSLDAYYQVSQAPFESYLKSEFPTTADEIIKKYDDVGITGRDMKELELYEMGTYLNKWNTRQGFMRLGDTVTEFDDPFDKIKFIESNK